MIVGHGAALLQGAPAVTDDLDIWFKSYSNQATADAVRKAGGVLIWQTMPPLVAGKGFEHIDIVVNCDGLKSFSEEYKLCHTVKLHGVKIKVLPLDRIIASKQAANREKDRAALPSLRAVLAAQKRKPK